MKLLYSQLKKLLPGLDASAKEVADILTLIGFFHDGLQKVTYQGERDYVLSIEVRQNRPDCLSVIGLAREVAAYYGLDLVMPAVSLLEAQRGDLGIDVVASKVVKRLLAVEIEGIKLVPSPDWLKELLELQGMNSRNLLVDVSNYVMLMTGYPSHLLDAKKITGRLAWSLNNSFDSLTTLDNSQVELRRGELLIRDDKEPLALAGMVGGVTARIADDTEKIIAEMAIYDPVIIRQNVRSLKIVTEASIRLEKDLSPSGINEAMALLVALIQQSCPSSKVVNQFEYYPEPVEALKIKFNPHLPSVYSGVIITPETTATVLQNLRFEVKQKDVDSWVVVPPLDRTDVIMQADVVEEAIRLVGFDKISSNKIPALAVTTDITPPVLLLVERMKDMLVALGYDEVRSWPITKPELNQAANCQEWDSVVIQNSVNEEYTDLRQSMAAGLLWQMEEHGKNNLEFIRLFESGRVFGQEGKDYVEEEHLGLLSSGGTLREVQETVEILLRMQGITEIAFRPARRKPLTANPYACWEIFISDKQVGIIYQTRQPENTFSAELHISAIDMLLCDNHPQATVELTQKLVVLDANIELGPQEDIRENVQQLRQQIGEDKIWSLWVMDVFPLEKNIRYTIRVAYQGLSDTEAKQIHSSI